MSIPLRDKSWADRIVSRALAETGPTYPIKHYTKSGMNEDKIIDHWENPRHRGRLLSASHTGSAKNDDCGDEISIDFLSVGGRIEGVNFDGKGCVLCLAGASMLVESLIGKPLEAAKQLSERDMLSLYEGVPHPVRMTCCLLPLEALRNACEV